MTDERDTPQSGSAKLILRNLLNTPYHMRLGDPEKPYRVQLSPRGTSGDIRNVPAKFADDEAVVTAYNLGIIDSITEAEAREAARSYQKTGTVRRRIPVIRPQDTSVTVGRISHDAKGNPVLSRAEGQEQANERMQAMGDATQVRGAGPRIVGRGGGIQGADDALAEAFVQAEEDAILEKLSPELRERVLQELGIRSAPVEDLEEAEVRFSDDEVEGEEDGGFEITPRKRVSEEDRAAHEAFLARAAVEGDFDDAELRRRSALEEKGVLPEGVLRPKVKIERARGEQPGVPSAVEDPTAWQNQPGARPPQGAR